MDLDIGAIDHVCHSAHMVTTYSPSNLSLLNFLVGILFKPNMLELFTLMMISTFLYIPCFNTNLIFVPRMTNILQCNVIFNAHQCFIDGIPTLNNIGAPELQHGLFVLTYPTLQHTLNHALQIHYIITNKCNL